MNTQPKNSRTRVLPAFSSLTVLCAAALLGLCACMTDSGKDPAPKTEKGFLFAVTSDRTTGSYSVYGLDSAFQAKDIEPIGSDAVVRYLGGNDIYVLNRYKRDNLQVIDRHSFKTVLQLAFPPLSNPYDIAVKDSLLYVAFLGLDKIMIYHQRDGGKKGEIDLSAYADTSDKLPEATELLFVEDDLFVLTANLDTKKGHAPLQSHLLKIDVAAGSVKKALDLPYGNPVSMSYDSAAGKIWIPCRGAFFDESFALKLDGGIVSVELAAFTVKDTVATEAGLGGSLNKLVLHGGKAFMDLSYAEATKPMEKIVAISLKDGKAEDIATMTGYMVGGLAIDTYTSTLFVGDAENGLRIFDLATYKERDPSMVSLGLPTSDLAIIR